MTNNLIKDNIQLDSTKLTRDGADGYSSALFELHLQLHSQVSNPYTFNPKQNYNSYSTLKESYNYDGVYGPIPDDNGLVDLTFYAENYIPEYSTVTIIPEENQKYLNSGILPSTMDHAFYALDAINTLDVSKINTKYVTSLNYCFGGRDSGKEDEPSVLTEIIGLDKWDTSNVTSCVGTFRWCQALKSLDLSNFNTSNVVNMSEMFNLCQKLTTLDLSNFDTSKVTDMNNMFYDCNSLTTLDLSSFDTSNVIDMNYMFYDCNFKSLDLSNFNTSNVTNMWCMFCGCSFRSLDLSNFNTSNVINMSQMFQNCDFIETINLSSFDTSKVTNMYEMFGFCNKLTTIIGTLDLSSCQNIEYMFAGASSNIKGVHFKNVPRSLDWSNTNGIEGETYIIDNYID